jgi:hypothetical protein
MLMAGDSFHRPLRRFPCRAYDRAPACALSARFGLPMVDVVGKELTVRTPAWARCRPAAGLIRGPGRPVRPAPPCRVPSRVLLSAPAGLGVRQPGGEQPGPDVLGLGNEISEPLGRRGQLPRRRDHDDDLPAGRLTDWIMVLLDGFLGRIAGEQFDPVAERDMLLDAARRLIAP